ncbi:hypothetical protein B7486_51195, partial [cyanobacterium TDX16]
ICFSKSEEMHDIVIGLFINRYEFALIDQLSVVVGAGLASRFTGSSHHLRSKPARTVISYQLSVISDQLILTYELRLIQ